MVTLLAQNENTATAVDCKISVKTFLSTMFRDLPPGEVAALTPMKGLGGPANEWRMADVATVQEARYTIVSSILPQDQQENTATFQTQEVDCVSQYAIMLDDFGDGEGSKTSLDNLTVPPSALVETSPGNHQAIYFLETPNRDFDFYKGTLQGLMDKTGADQGAKGVTRKMRVPGSQHRTGWRARVVDWHPERRFTLQGLLVAYGVTAVVGKKKRALR